MSWLQKLLPPKIKRDASGPRKAVPEGLWSKCSACETVLYRTDLEKNLQVCPKCSHHNRITARERLDGLFDLEGRYEIGSEVLPVDTLKFKDSKRYVDRIGEARQTADEEDALIVMPERSKMLGCVVWVADAIRCAGSVFRNMYFSRYSGPSLAAATSTHVVPASGVNCSFPLTIRSLSPRPLIVKIPLLSQTIFSFTMRDT